MDADEHTLSLSEKVHTTLISEHIISVKPLRLMVIDLPEISIT